MSTFQQTTDVLRAGDEARLRALCADVALRGGIESTVSLLAMRDAECGLPLRSRAKILGHFWRTTLGARSERARYPRQNRPPSACAPPDGAAPRLTLVGTGRLLVHCMWQATQSRLSTAPLVDAAR